MALFNSAPGQARLPRLHPAIIVTALLALAGAAQAADSTAKNADNYTWSARLVAVDRDASTVTVESLVATTDGLAKADKLKSGDPAMLTWSGVFSASGVRSVVPGTHSDNDRFTMPIVFVSKEMNGRYVRFKVPVPRTDLKAIEALKAGDWVTATSPHHVMHPEDAVISIRPYNSVSAS